MLKTLVRVTQRANTLFRMLSEPGVFELYKSGGIPLTYFELNQPWLRELEVKTVLDIGANAGAFALTALKLYPQAHVHAFEPLPECVAALEKLHAQHPRLHIHAVGVGDQNGVVEFFRTPQNVSSSFLKPSTTYDQLTGVATALTSLPIQIRTLDAIAAEIGFAEPMLVKIDVQGFEDRVLRGGAMTLRRAHAMLVETSSVPQYHGALTYKDIICALDDLGFEYAGVAERVVTSKRGRIVSEDTLFVNRSLVQAI
jgi:FkbM family methyltransferase